MLQRFFFGLIYGIVEPFSIKEYINFINQYNNFLFQFIHTLLEVFKMQVLDIFNIYEEYKDKYPDVNYPELTEDNISYANDVDYWFAFNNEELYSDIYNLKVCMEAFCLKDSHIKSCLFHEFTHLYDSLKFKQFPFEKYKSVMLSYSEINASYIGFDYLFSGKGLTTKTKMKHLDHVISVGNWLQKEIRRIQRMWKNETFESPDVFMTELRLLCYFIGQYTYLYKRIPNLKFDLISPYQPEINIMFQKYDSLDISLYMEYDALIDKYRKYKLQESTKNFAALTNGAISVEKLLEHADQVNKNL